MSDSPVEDYLDRLLGAAPGPPREVRALLAEAEAHLRDATAAGIASGLSLRQAEEQAVARFGPVRTVTAAEGRRQSLPLAVVTRQVISSGLLLGAIGALAVGVSGLVAAALAAVKGSTFIVNISHSTHLAPSDCARWLSQDHGAHSCYQAALSDWTFEVVAYRVLIGVLGALALGLYVIIRRRGLAGLPPAVVDTIAVTAFGVAGAWTLGLGIDWVVQGTNGAGQWLAAAPISLVLAGLFGWRLLGDVRRPSALLS